MILPRPDSDPPHLRIPKQHAALSPSSSASSYSLQTALSWFRLQNDVWKGLGAPKNINTMSPFYSLACIVADGLVVGEDGKEVSEEDERYRRWLDEWAEWVMNDLPRKPSRLVSSCSIGSYGNWD